MDSQKFGYTIDQAVDHTGIGRTKIYQAIKEGRLRARKCGRRTVILAGDLAAFMQALPVMEAA